MHPVGRHLRAHVRLATASAVGLGVALVLPASFGLVQRALVGWNLAVWFYLALAGWMMAKASHQRLRQVADAQADSAGTVLVMVSVASVVSLAGTVLELTAARLPGAQHTLPHVLLAVATVVGAWLLLPTMFALTYAAHYYRDDRHSDDRPGGGGLQFPGADTSFQPVYSDFLYVAFTIAAAAQTSDVTITTPAMRRLVLAQSVLSFAFNTAVLALSINLAAALL